MSGIRRESVHNVIKCYLKRWNWGTVICNTFNNGFRLKERCISIISWATRRCCLNRSIFKSPWELNITLSLASSNKRTCYDSRLKYISGAFRGPIYCAMLGVLWDHSTHMMLAFGAHIGKLTSKFTVRFCFTTWALLHLLSFDSWQYIYHDKLISINIDGTHLLD